MITGTSLIEIKIVPAIETAKSFGLVTHAVRMDYVHNHGYAHRMSLIHQMLEFFRSSETAAECEEIRHLIAETAIIRMLLECHYLYSIIAQTLNPR